MITTYHASFDLQSNDEPQCHAHDNTAYHSMHCRSGTDNFELFHQMGTYPVKAHIFIFTGSLTDCPSTTRVDVIKIAAQKVVLEQLFLLICHFPPLPLCIIINIIVIRLGLHGSPDCQGQSDAEKNHIRRQNVTVSKLNTFISISIWTEIQKSIGCHSPLTVHSVLYTQNTPRQPTSAVIPVSAAHPYGILQSE